MPDTPSIPPSMANVQSGQVPAPNKESIIWRLQHKTDETIEKKEISLQFREVTKKNSWEDVKDLKSLKNLIITEVKKRAIWGGLDSVSKSSTSNVTTPLKRILFHAAAWLSDALTGHSETIANLVKSEDSKLAESEKASPLVRILSGVFFALSIPVILIVAVATLPVLPAGLPIKIYDLLQDSKHRKQIYNNIISQAIELVFIDFGRIDMKESDWQKLGKVVQQSMNKANKRDINFIKQAVSLQESLAYGGKTLPQIVSEILATSIGDIAKTLQSKGNGNVAEIFKKQFLDNDGNLFVIYQDKLSVITQAFSKHINALANL